MFVTDRGRPTHVLMSIEDYRRLSGETESIVDLLAWPGPDIGESIPTGRWDVPER